jgi:hypothetical protein
VRGYAVRLAVVALLAAAGLGVPAAAQAASCSSAHGVTVVVDFHQLGGGVHSACDAGGAGRTAAQQLTDVGHQLTYVQRQPGFVCRVDGAPADDPCVNTPPANAYWGLWWTDGTSTTWHYSAEGVGSLTVPDGGYVALSWQGGGAKAPPGVTPRVHPSASPTPTQAPSSHPTHHPTKAPTSHPTQSPSSATPTSGAGPTGSAGHSASPTHGPTHRPSSSATSAAAGPGTASGSPDTTQAAGAANPTSDDASGSSGLPAWVPALLVVLLLGAAAAVTVVRRKRSGGT